MGRIETHHAVDFGASLGANLRELRFGVLRVGCMRQARVDLVGYAVGVGYSANEHTS